MLCHSFKFYDDMCYVFFKKSIISYSESDNKDAAKDSHSVAKDLISDNILVQDYIAIYCMIIRYI